MTYVDTKIIANLLKNSELLIDLINNVMIKAMGEHQVSKEANNLNQSKNSDNKKEIKKIQIKPFKLTQPKPKLIQEPIKIPNKIIAKEFPLEAFHKKSLKTIEMERNNRLEIISENVIKKYKSIPVLELKTAKRPTNIDKISKEINEKREQELQFDMKYHQPLRDFNTLQANVKYNETAILREEYLIKKKQKEEEEELKKILVEKKDASEFERWKREMEERDNLLRAEEITRRKLELDLNREVATEYFNQRILHNKLQVAKHKEEESKKMAEKMKIMNEELLQKKILVKEVEKEREYVMEEKEKMIQKKKEIYQMQNEEYKDLVLKANEEKKADENRRKDIILQIRELERLPFKRFKGFDPTETPGHGLLEEMSLAELRERLEMQKKFLSEYVEGKKEENRLKQTERNEDLLEKANMVMNYRDLKRNNKEIERKKNLDEKNQKLEKLNSIREKSLLEFKDKIDNKKKKMKQEEEILEKKIREINLQRQYLQQGRVINIKIKIFFIIFFSKFFKFFFFLFYFFFIFFLIFFYIFFRPLWKKKHLNKLRMV